MKATMKPHDFRELVNALHETARTYAGTQQLRARLSLALRAYVILAEDKPDERNSKPLSN